MQGNAFADQAIGRLSEELRVTFRQGVEAFQSGDLDRATTAFHTVVDDAPDQAEALHMLGVIAHRRGTEMEAIAFLQRAVALDPENAGYLNNLAMAQRGAGEVDAAEISLRQAIDRSPLYAGAHYNLANVLRSAGRRDDAIGSYREAIAADPGFADAHINLAATLLEAGDPTAAEPHADQAVLLAPTSGVAHGVSAAVHLAVGRLENAISGARRALEIDPTLAEPALTFGDALIQQGHFADAVTPLRDAAARMPRRAEAHNSVGIACTAIGFLDEGEAAFRQALQLQPDLVESHSNLGHLLIEAGRLDEACGHAMRAIEVEPSFSSGWINLGAALLGLHRPTDALTALETAKTLVPDSVEGLTALGSCYDALGRHEDALASYAQVVALDPTYAPARFNRALTLLTVGNYGDGFSEYEWRLKLGSDAVSRFSSAIWDGGPLDGKTILLHAEQGFGDTVQFLRFLPHVKACGGKVVLACQAPLLRLLEQCREVDQLVSLDDAVPTHDVHAPLASLPHIFGVTLETLPAPDSYLAPPDGAWPLETPARVGRRVGLAWAGGGANKINSRRSCPAEALRPIAETRGVAFYSLQVGPNAKDLAAAGLDNHVVSLSDRLGDFADTAGAIAGMDLVITVDTVIAHLAGALGKPVWVMLSHAGDWRYLADRTDSPWYPSMRLFRQSAANDWAGVVDAVRSALANEFRS
jgi:tetratricopeptide (TPR) repeat protein